MSKKTRTTSTKKGSWLATMLVGKRIPQYWSVSAYEAHSECPTMYALGRVIKYCLFCGSTAGKKKVGGSDRCIKCGKSDPSVPAIERGVEIHSKAEAYLRGNTKGLPSELNKFAAEFSALLRRKAKPEVNWTLTVRGEPCLPTDWENAWLRVKIDAHDYEKKEKHLTIIDYKTGKEKPQEHQAEVYALVSPHFYPELETVSTEFWWTLTGSVTNVPVDKNREPTVWTRKDLAELQKKWWQRARVMLADRTFAATPGNHCGRCRFRSSNITNGRPGPCDAWRAAL